MTVFEDLKEQWADQPKLEVPNDGAKKIIEKITSIRRKQRITNIVLSTTALVLIGFFFYISAYKFQTVTLGLLLMIGGLILRIGIEFSSIRGLKHMNASTDTQNFKKQMIQYYKGRTKVHFIVTPLIIITYCIGFVLLLPSFKATLSSGFYSYIVISSVVLLVVLGIFIIKQIRKELLILSELKS